MNRARRTLLLGGAATVALGSLGSRLFGQGPDSQQGDSLEDLVLANRILAAHDIFDAYGHISLRKPGNPGRYLMSRSLAPELVTATDILEFDLDSNVTGDAKPALFRERFIHGEVYKARPEVNAVVHCHTPSLIPFGVTVTPLRPLFGLAGFISEGIPLFDIRKGFGMTDLLISDAARGKALAQTLGKKPAALLRGHGAVVTGASLQMVVGRCIYLELNARLQAQATALAGAPGKVTYLDPEEGKQSVADGYARAWELWRREAARAK